METAGCRAGRIPLCEKSLERNGKIIVAIGND
jgi:hypothetical protein